MKFQTNMNIHCRRIQIMYAPTLSEVVYRPLEVVIRALKKAHIYALCTFKKIEQCHKLLVVYMLGGGLAPTRSYSERWQVARIRLCCRGAVCGTLKF